MTHIPGLIAAESVGWPVASLVAVVKGGVVPMLDYFTLFVAITCVLQARVRAVGLRWHH